MVLEELEDLGHALCNHSPVIGTRYRHILKILHFEIGRGLRPAESYIFNVKRFMDISDGAGVDVIIVNHTEYNDALNRFECTKARKAGEPNPWIGGKGEVEKYLTVVEECAKAWLAIGDGVRRESPTKLGANTRILGRHETSRGWFGRSHWIQDVYTCTI